MRKSQLLKLLLESKDEQIRLLSSMQGFAPSRLEPLPAPPAPAVPDGTAAEVTDGDWLSEKEEAEKILEKLNLSAVHLPEILDGLGIS